MEFEAMAKAQIISVPPSEISSEWGYVEM
jgi:hypothetical protein